MEIKLSPQESEDLFFDALCNSLGEFSYYDLELEYDEAHFDKVKKRDDCYEDVLMAILRDGGTLRIVDHNGDYNAEITLKDVHDRVSLTPMHHLLDAINERGDAITGDCILQSVFFKDVIFG